MVGCLLTQCTGWELKGATCAVTGGCGFLGSYLVRLAIDAGAKSVRVLDVRSSPLFEELVATYPNVHIHLCDIRDEKAVGKALAGVDIVFHSASYFGSPAFGSRAYSDATKVYDINVNGTRSVLAASAAKKVKRFVYTSSVNVIFDGTTIENGDENIPYPAKHMDPYGASKAEAERLVLAFNGKSDMFTCALRPNGLYGPGDYIIGRSLKMFLPIGGILMNFGAGNSKPMLTDWTYVENIAYANILAASKLGSKPTTVGGQAYNITDGVPIPSMEFFKDIVIACGMEFTPYLVLPKNFLLFNAHLIERLCYFVRPFFNIHPILTPLEATKLCTTHYFNIDKAVRDLQYNPLPMKICKEVTAKFYAEKMQYAGNRHKVMVWITLLLVFFCVFVPVFISVLVR